MQSVLQAQEPNPGEDRPPGKIKLGRRINRAFGPIAAGLIIDLVDLATFGPIGLFLGLPIGGLAGYWMGKALGLERKHALWCALAAGIYCTIPFTEVIPLATLVGAFARFRESGSDEAERARLSEASHIPVQGEEETGSDQERPERRD